MRVRVLYLISILVLFSLLTFKTYANESESLVLMKASEIQQLPKEDREAYLLAVKAILAKGTEVFLVDESAPCASEQKACAAALYGGNLCIPRKTENGALACEKLARKQPGYRSHQWLIEPGGDSLWSAYEQRLSNFCQGSDSRGLCKELQDKRVEIFMNRRTH